MAAPNAQSAPPPLNPRKLKRLIERLSFDNQFRTHFEEIAQQSRGYDKIRSIDPEFPGPFSQYYLSLQYLLHDPRVEKIYEQNYTSLSNPQTLEYVCAELARQEHIMSDLDKGILFSDEDHKLIQEQLFSTTPEQQEQKIEAALKKVVEKKEAVKKEHRAPVTSTASGPKPIPSAVPVKTPPSTSTTTPTVSSVVETQKPSPIIITPQPVTPPRNPLSFRIKQVSHKITPIIGRSITKIASAGAIFYKRHPVTARAAIGATVVTAASLALRLPINPLIAMGIGAFSGEIIKKGVEAFSPDSRPEPSYEDNFEDQPDNTEEYSPSTQSSSTPHTSSSRFSLPHRPSLLNRAGNLRRGAQLARGLRGASLAVRALPLLANPIFWVVLIILILLLIVFMFIILPTTSLFPPFGDNAGGAAGDPKVKLVKSGPTEVQNGEKIQYKIEVTYTGSGVGTAEINDVLPNNVRYLQSSPSATVNGRTLTWKLTDLLPSLPRPITFEVQPEFNDSWVVNEATGRGSQSGSGSGGAGGKCPTAAEISENRKDRNACKYFGLGVNIFDTNLSQEAIDTYVKNYSRTFINAGLGDESEFRRRIGYIAERSKAVGLNPVIFLGLWKSESNFGAARNAATFGCAPGGGVKAFEVELNCAVGLTEDGKRRGSLSAQCASPNNPERDQACQIIRGIREKHPDIYGPDRVNLPITTFDDFVETYGPRSPILDGPGTQNNNCIASYNTLVEVALESKACTESSSTGGTITAGSGKPTKCSGTVVNLGYEKILLPLPEEKNCSSTATGACGRPGKCVAAKKIVVHTTASPKNGQEIFNYFAGGSENRGVGAHFIIDKDGKVIQAVETLADSVEVAYAVANYSDHISLELIHNGVYANKGEAPAAQYAATLKLVKQLMQQYQIPVGDIEYSWLSRYDGYNGSVTPGVYGHYQLNPSNRTDPGDGFLRDLREELK